MLFRTPEMEENPLWVSIHRRSPGQNLTGGIGALSHRRRYAGMAGTVNFSRIATNPSFAKKTAICWNWSATFT